MENMLNYIFSTLKTTESALKNVDRAFRRQNIVNRRNAAFALAVTAWVYVSETRYKKDKEELEKKLDSQEKMIINLGAQVRALNAVKGEAKM